MKRAANASDLGAVTRRCLALVKTPRHSATTSESGIPLSFMGDVMNRLASPAQLRASLLRWTAFLVPLIVLLGFVAGALSGSGADNAWFDNLVKPSIYPPPATFGIVWSILYAMTGFALALVCSAWGSRWRNLAIVAFVVQFVVNLAWSPTFFGAQNMQGALVVILVLDVAAIIATWLFFKVRRAAGLLMLPYIVWILFATALNWQFIQANPDGGGMVPGGDVQRIEL